MPSLLNKPSPTPACVHEMLASVEGNTRKIASLTKLKNKHTEKISATLDFLRLSKKYLSEPQIEAFVKFAAISKINSSILPNITKQPDAAEAAAVTAAKEALLHTNADLDFVYGKLSALAASQQSVLGCLENIISFGDKLLQSLNSLDCNQ